MSEFAKGLSNVTNFSKRRHSQRINRRLDDRDNILMEALRNLEQRLNVNYPVALLVPADIAAPSVAGGAATGLLTTGVNFIGDSTKSEGSTENSAGVIDFDAVLPGEQTITVTITNTGAALAVTASVTAGTITVVHGSGGPSTATAVASAVNTHAEAKFMVNATVGTAGAMSANESVSVDGGTGDLMTVAIGSFAFDGNSPGNGITDVSDTVITLDLNPADIDGAATSLVVGDAYAIQFRVDGVLVNMPFMVPVT
jgi:hypothetical protein